MLAVTYNAQTGIAVPDGEAEAFVLARYAESQGTNLGITISSEIVIQTLRALIKEKKIDRNQVDVIFNGKVLEINDAGRLRFWPRGFCDNYSNILDRLLDWNENPANI